MRCLRYALLINFIVCFLFSSAQIVKVTKAYTAEATNYNLQKGGKSLDKLTDQIVASRVPMWLDDATLGWQKKDKIQIDFELGSLYSIKNISLSTAVNDAANALNPLSISVFYSVDGKEFDYATDIADRSFDVKKGYFAYTLSKSLEKVEAKYIRFIIYPQGTFFFTDEIQIKGNPISKVSKTIQSKSVSSIALNNYKLQQKKAILVSKARQSGKNELIKEIEMSAKMDEHVFAEFERKIATDKSILALAKSEIVPTASTVLWTMNDRNPVFANKIQINHVKNTSTYILLNVANTFDTKKTVIPKLNFSNKYSLYELTQITTRKNQVVYDPLVPIDMVRGLEIDGKSRKYLVLEIKAVHTGQSKGTIAFGDSKSQVDLDINQVDVGITDQYIRSADFAVNVWPYYSYKFYKGKELSIREDLNNHYVNVFLLPSWILGSTKHSINREAIIEQLKYRKSNDKVFLFLNQSEILKNPGDYLKDSWYRRFYEWYDEVYKLLNENGVSEDDIYLYPFDELVDSEVPYFNQLVHDVKSKRHKTKIFTTIFRSSVLKNLTDLVDVKQIVTTNNDYVKLNIKGDYWIYDIMDDSKGTNPNTRYRAQAWKAFAYGAKGVGFWNYADMEGESIWDDNDGKRADYNVVYDLNNTIIPSLRWEAFKRGVQEYFILKKIAEGKGNEAGVKSKVKAIIEKNNVSEKEFNSLLDDMLKVIK